MIQHEKTVAEIVQGIIDQHSGWISNPKAYRQFGNMGEDIRTALRAERDRAEKAEAEIASLRKRVVEVLQPFEVPQPTSECPFNCAAMTMDQFRAMPKLAALHRELSEPDSQ